MWRRVLIGANLTSVRFLVSLTYTTEEDNIVDQPVSNVTLDQAIRPQRMPVSTPKTGNCVVLDADAARDTGTAVHVWGSKVYPAGGRFCANRNEEDLRVLLDHDRLQALAIGAA